MRRSDAIAHLLSWAGALLFVASLGYFLFTYLAIFGVAAPADSTATAVTFNVMLFTAFALHHSIFARGRVRHWIAHLASPELERSVYVWIASLLFILVCAAWLPVPGTAWQADGIALWTLRTLQAAGLALIARSARILDVWELAGLRRPQSEVIGGLQPSEFKTTGPYGWVRHPIYAGWFLFVFAASPMTMTRLAFAVVSGVYLLIAIPLEERTLRKTSAGAYDRYTTTVRWRLVPGLY
ncbi:MAG: isoprenylcysteine carboxylmethyltransferase family protein [Acidobacteria bacterium]|nr:isoprenylcysteine carboxylmethyltransferase family protein [Acidobacteriota bacterium]